MRFASFALAALFSAAAFCSPAAAYEIDPITREPVFYLPTAHRPQATATQRQLVSFTAGYAPGTVVVSTSQRRLYYVLGGGQAISYGIDVGRPGFTWAGTKTISMNREWPDWRPGADVEAPPGSPALHVRGDQQPAWRPRHVSRRLDVPHPRLK